MASARERGNAAFQAGDFESALAAYSEGIDNSGGPSIAEVPLLLNRAQCCLKLGRSAEAEADCSAVLLREGGNVKALYRRALAHEAQGRLADALRDTTRLLHVDRTNAAGVQLLQRLRRGPNGGGGTGGAAAAPAASRATLDVDECMELLRDTGAAPEALDAALMSLTATGSGGALSHHSFVQRFLLEQGPLLLVEKAAGAGGNRLTSACNALLLLFSAYTMRARAGHRPHGPPHLKQSRRLEVAWSPEKVALRTALASRA